MNRLTALLRWEALIQWRQGIFYAAAFVAALWSAMLFRVPDTGIEPLLLSILFIDLSLFGFFFMAALYYLEKGERVVEGLVVTPLRSGEYLSVKVALLTGIAVAVGAVVILLSYGAGINWFWYLLAVLAMSVPLCLLGFTIAVRYSGINEYLVPGSLYLLVMQIPLLGYFEIGGQPFGQLVYLLPSGPGLRLLEAAFGPVPIWQSGASLFYAALLTVGGYILARRAFDSAVARKAGG